MNFPKLKHFKESEFHEPEKMNHDLLHRLDAYREYIGVPVFISSSTDGVHAKNSQHYLGNAVDIIPINPKGSLIAQFLIAERFGFTGIGIYPDWCYNGKTLGGLHLDRRPENNLQAARWIGKKLPNPTTGEIETQYFPLSIRYLKKFKILT
jgi:hypothetical protein